MTNYLDIQNNYSLLGHNTFAIDCAAAQFITVHSVDDLQHALSEYAGKSFLLLGGGSNLLLDRPAFEAPVFWMHNMGIRLLGEKENSVRVQAMAGENWHDFVSWCVAQGYGGLENLSLIPGTVGAAPIQNIGAYGVELKDTVISVEAINVRTRQTRHFSREECLFGYRESVFKRQQRGQWIIHAVTFELTRNQHQLHLDYGAIADRLAQAGVEHPDIADVRAAVIAIRQERLPDPAHLPNAGSFFKNPVIEQADYQQLAARYPQMPAYPQADGMVKLPAAWLIEQCGWKGHRESTVGVHAKHALVLVNHGGASGADVIKLARQIQQDVHARFGVSLALEVNLGSDAVFPEY